MIIFENAGRIDTRSIVTFGVNVKETENPIGYFGTGLKYALAVLLREKQQVTMYVGTTKYEFRLKSQQIRGKEFQYVTMDEHVLPFTTSLGKGWLLWHAYRELAANAYDEPEGRVYHDELYVPHESKTAFCVDGLAFKSVHEDRASIFLKSDPIYSFPNLKIHSGPGKWLYCNGIRVHELSKPAMYDYNLIGSVRLTEDRTLQSIYTAHRVIANTIAQCTQSSLIRQLLEANQNHWESTVDYNWPGLEPGKTFNTVVEVLKATRRSFNQSAGHLYSTYHSSEELPDRVQWETLSIQARLKLRQAWTFWRELGIQIDWKDIFVTDKSSLEKGIVKSRLIFIAQKFLEVSPVHEVASQLYKLHAEAATSRTKISQTEYAADQLVVFGKEILKMRKAQQPQEASG